MAANDFWSEDRTTIHEKTTWYGKLPPKQKLCYTLLLLFTVFWFFYLGMNIGAAAYPDITMVSRPERYNPENDPNQAGYQPPPVLEGTDVILLVGADKREGENVYRTDTIMLAFFNWEKSQIKVLSIPRDSYVQLPGYPTRTKINEAYFYGGISLLTNTIEYTFGLAVEYYVEVDFDGFIQLIDALGGVDINVPQGMHKASENISIEAGQQTLNGYDALGFVRFRDLPMGDIDRIANQQAFIQAVADKLSGNTASLLLKAPQLAKIAWDNVTTNYTLSEAVSMVNSVLQSDLSNIEMYSLPGNGMWIGQGNYWMLNRQGVIQMISEFAEGEATGETHIIYNDNASYSAPSEEPPEEEDPEGENPDEPLEGEGTGTGEAALPGEGTDSTDPNNPTDDPNSDPNTSPDPNAGNGGTEPTPPDNGGSEPQPPDTPSDSQPDTPPADQTGGGDSIPEPAE